MERHTGTFGASASGVMATLTGSTDGMAPRRRGDGGSVGRGASGCRDHVGRRREIVRRPDLRRRGGRGTDIQLPGDIPPGHHRDQRIATGGAAGGSQPEQHSRPDRSDGAHWRRGKADQRYCRTDQPPGAPTPTIEAARAGDAGKGFAVVAGGSEAALAAQTGKATADIAGQIEMVRTATTKATIAAMK